MTLHMSTSSSIFKDSIDEPRRIKRSGVETSFGLDFLTSFLIEDFDVNFLSDQLVSAFFIEEDPKTNGEAMRFISVSFSKEAIKSELDFTVANQTWELVELPKAYKPISYSEWILKKKLKPNISMINTKLD